MQSAISQLQACWGIVLMPSSLVGLGALLPPWALQAIPAVPFPGCPLALSQKHQHCAVCRPNQMAAGHSGPT